MSLDDLHPQSEDEQNHSEDEALGDPAEEPHFEAEDACGKKSKKKRDSSTLRKAPSAPKRFKSSYICFFMAKQPEIKEELGDKASVSAISKRSAEMWKNLPQEERSHWDDVAAKDKQRYMVEKASYTGPWQVPWKRARKDPSAPKRPMSAFLYFSQGKRTQIKKENPEMKNTEVSRILGEMWRNLTDEEREPHVERERKERDKYKIAIAQWRKENEDKQEAQRKAQAEQIEMAANMPESSQLPMYPPPMPTDPYSHPGMSPVPMNSYMYHQGYPYMYPPGPYHFPMNGKQPVILGPNGMPVPQPTVVPYNTNMGNPGPSPSGAPAMYPTNSPQQQQQQNPTPGSMPQNINTNPSPVGNSTNPAVTGEG